MMITRNWHVYNNTLVSCVAIKGKLCAKGGEHFRDMTWEEAQEQYDSMVEEKQQMREFAWAHDNDF